MKRAKLHCEQSEQLHYERERATSPNIKKKKAIKKLNVLMCLIGLIGILVISIISIAESQTGTVESLVYAIPAAILFANLFVAGYITINKLSKQ